MEIHVPGYSSKNGFTFNWEPGFSVKCTTCDIEGILEVRLEANKQGLISLARHLLELSQDSVPENYHIHLDEYGSLEEGSTELIIIKRSFDFG